MMFARTLTLLVFGAAAWHATQLSIENARHVPIRTIAERVETGRTVDQASLSAEATRILATQTRAGCRSGILRPGLSVILHDAANMNQASDYDSWSHAHGQARDYMTAMEHCLPSDGNLWLRDALVDRAVAEDPAQLVRKMRLAARLAPFEDHQVLARLHFWKTASPQTLAAGQALARTDLSIALRYGSDALKAAITEEMSPDFETLWQTEVARTTLLSVN